MELAVRGGHGRPPLSGVSQGARQALGVAFAGPGSMAERRTAPAGGGREPAAAADRRAPALVRRDRPARDRVLRLPRPWFRASLRHLPGVHRPFGVAQRLPAHPLPRAHPAQHGARHLAARLRHPAALGAALPDWRHREPVHLPAGSAGDGVSRLALAAQHHRARSARRGGHRAAGVLSPAAAVVSGQAFRAAMRSTMPACWPPCCRA